MPSIPRRTSGLDRAVGDGLRRLAALPADGRLAAAHRIAFGALALVMALTALPFIDLAWWHRLPEAAGLARFLHAAAVVLAVAVLLGAGGRSMLLAHLAVAAALSTLEITGPSIEKSLYLIQATWLLAAGTGELSIDAWWRRRRAPTARRAAAPGWAYWLLGLDLGLLLTLAAVSKLFDPLWRQGTGFYAFFRLPWLNTGALDGALELEWLMRAANHAGLAFELLFLPLVLIPRTRVLALVLAALFFAGLTWPIQLGFIGPLGLVACLALAAITPAINSRLPHRAHPASAPPAGRRARILIAAAVAYLVLSFANALGAYDLRYPSVAWPLAVAEADGTVHAPGGRPSLGEAIGDVAPALRPVLRLLGAANEYGTMLRPLILFTSVHTVGIWTYRIEARLDDGSAIEPWRLVDDDMRPGPDSAGLRPRFLRYTMYWITQIANRFSADEGFVPDERERAWLGALFDAAEARTPAAVRPRVRAWVVRVRPIAVPAGFAGRDDPGPLPWRDLVARRPSREMLEWRERPPPFPARPRVEGLRHPAWIEVRP